MPEDLVPERPSEAGVPEEVPEEVTAIEGARTLANEARSQLRERGFSDDEIDRWADAFLAEHGPGELPDFLRWIEAREQSR
jgi:hypothetical protein